MLVHNVFLSVSLPYGGESRKSQHPVKTIRHSLEVNFSELNSSFFAVTSSFYFCDVMLFLKGKKEETVFFSHAGTLPKMLCSLHFVTYSHRRNLKEKKSLSRCWVVERVENVLKKIWNERKKQLERNLATTGL